MISTCHQYNLRQKRLQDDLEKLDFDYKILTPKHFSLKKEFFSNEIKMFIERYEWLGTIGVYPKWIFTARYKNILCGVVLINEPTAYSKLLGDDTPRYEALIQRGACISWSPKGLASRLIMFSCRWMVKNTNKRFFVAYSDPEAGEVGIVYQACNFDFLGNSFGASKMYIHDEFKGGLPFSSQTLNRTSTLKLWAGINGISLEKEWIKENGFKNLNNIPEKIKECWKCWKKKVIEESITIFKEKKGKYAYVLGNSKKELKELKKLKNYKTKEYPKRIVTDNVYKR